MTTTLAVDVGRTTCRVALFDGDNRLAEARGASGASLADPAGARRIAAAVRATLEGLPVDGQIDTLALGTTGLAQAPAAALALREELAVETGADEIVLASDVLTAHLGALGGSAGVCLVAGTGAVALALAPDRRPHLVDGHGYLLGDAGSGFAIGREGMMAALRHHDGRPGGSAALAARAEAGLGPLDGLAGRVQSDPDAVRTVAGFAAAVADAARGGDDVARRIWRDAVRALAETVIAACRYLDRPDTTIGLAGSLSEIDDLVTTPLAALVTDACPGARVQRARGDALDGARRLAGPLPGLDLDRLQADGLLVRYQRGSTRIA